MSHQVIRTQRRLDLMDTARLLEAAYAAFNARDVETALDLMHPDVAWPNGMEGGTVVGRAAVRDYRTRQWGMIDPSVDPVRFEATSDGRVVYAFENSLIKKMEIR